MFREQLYTEPQAHTWYLWCPENKAKLNKVWLLRFWLEKYCRGGIQVEKGEYLWQVFTLYP